MRIGVPAGEYFVALSSSCFTMTTNNSASTWTIGSDGAKYCFKPVSSFTIGEDCFKAS
jgi:hypothetical protein